MKAISKFLLIVLDILFLIGVCFLVFKGLLINFLLMITVVLSLFYYEGIYDFRYDFWQEIKKIFKALFFSFLIIMSVSSFMKNNNFSFIFVYFLILFILFPIYRRIIKRVIYKLPFFKEKVKVFDDSNKIQNEIKKNWYLGMVNNEENFDVILINSKDLNLNQLEYIVEKYLYDKKIYLVPYLNDIDFSNSKIFEYSNIRTNIINLEHKLLKKSNVILKNLLDLLLALIIFPFFLFIHFIIIFLIKIDSKGKVFFKQKRIGKDGKIFVCYKYRTMYENGEEILNNYLKNHSEEIEYYKKYHKYKNDPRITKIGKFLRITSLDELPQIINVLKGEMSFVGPRPYISEEVKNINNINIIFKVKPGITGLWQVSGRNNLTFEERLEIDKWYIKNWSLWLDFVILIKTLKVVFLKIGAK